MDDLLNRLTGTLAATDVAILADDRRYLEWQASRQATFTPSASDDVDLRTQPQDILNFATDEWQSLMASDLEFLSAVGARGHGRFL